MENWSKYSSKALHTSLGSRPQISVLLNYILNEISISLLAASTKKPMSLSFVRFSVEKPRYPTLDHSLPPSLPPAIPLPSFQPLIVPVSGVDVRALAYDWLGRTLYFAGRVERGGGGRMGVYVLHINGDGGDEIFVGDSLEEGEGMRLAVDPFRG